jgi:hypothetical protein
MTTAPVRKSAVAQRLKPAAAAGIGVLVLGLNVAMLVGMQRFYPFGTLLGTVLLSAGGFGVVVGEPQDAYGYQPLWFKAGLIAMALVGVVIGIVLNVGLTAD